MATRAETTAEHTGTKPPVRDRLATEFRRIWTAVGVMMALSLIVAIPYNVFFDTARTDPVTYYVVSYMGYWTVFVVVYTIMTLWVFRRRDRADLEHVLGASAPKQRSALARWFIDGGGAVSWTVQVSVLSVLIIVVLWTNERYRSSVAMTLGGGVLVAACWLMMVISYAVQYAREDLVRPGLKFAGTEPPVFDDYFYQSITVSTSVALSDVSATTTQMRRVVRSHTLVAFAFNTVIVALLVSLLTVAAG